MAALLSPQRIFPGAALTVAVATAAFGLEHVEQALWGRTWLEALILAIMLGSTLRTCIDLPAATAHGIRFAAKPVMEGAVALMGASVSLWSLAGAGLPLVGGIVVVIALTIVLGYQLGRWLGLSDRLALLVACGNAICGNSAIAAVAPAIQADGEDVAASVGFTAVMGIVVVLAVAPLATILGLTPAKAGILAGMTVYAVPQVLAAANPLGSVAVQVGTLVKLVRVLMLGPVVAILSMLHRRGGVIHGKGKFSSFIPIFIIAFMGLAGLRSMGLIPDAISRMAHDGSLLLTVVAMAGLGLGVNLRSVAKAGPRVTASVVLSLMVLFAGALTVIRLLR